jgi:hypothetical protein
MRKLDVLRFAATAAFVVTTSLPGVVPAQAAGLSDKQKDEISEFLKCNAFLLRGDLVSFEADPDCGHGPVGVDWKSLGSGGGGGSSGSSCAPHDDHGGWEPGEWTPPSMSARGLSVGENTGKYGKYSKGKKGSKGDSCHDGDYKPHKQKHKYKHKHDYKDGWKPGDGGSPGDGGTPGDGGSPAA